MPRWKDDEDRGAFGAWLSARVGEQTFDWLAVEMAARGHRHGADYYRAMASGNKPPGRIIGRALREYFGEAPEQERLAEPSLAAALIDLTAELRESRLAREATEARLRALEAAVALQARPDASAPRARRVPQANAG